MCYAINFEKFDNINHQYEYYLRFNVSNQLYPDHYHTNWDPKIVYQPDYVGYTSDLYKKGVIFTQILIENFII